MKNRAYIIRNYRPEDFDSLVRLVSRTVDSEEGLHSVSAHDVIEALRHPRHFPEHDLFIAERARDVVGYINVTAELGIGRVVLSYLIDQERGGEVAAVKLIDPAIRRGRELKAEKAHVNVPEGSMSGQRLLARMGFRSVRRFLVRPVERLVWAFNKCRHQVWTALLQAGHQRPCRCAWPYVRENRWI